MQNDEAVPCAQPFRAGSFEGQVAVVTGGGTGLGLEVSRGLAALGAKVVIASRSGEHHKALLDEAAERGWHVEAETFDVREVAQVTALAAAVLERHGAVDILVNNAAGNFVCPAERLSERAWRAVLGIVLDGTFYCSREFGRPMLKRGQGQMLNIVATYAWTGMPGVVHSASAKAGVLAMTRTLAAEWGSRGVRVNAVAPGPFESRGAAANLWPDEEVRRRIEGSVPLGRFATADEVAMQCLWMLSPASAYMNGECLVVDGGGWLGKGMWNDGRPIERKKG
ncbi:MAG: SDR family oxidoreductase [Planctomycetaceae bacterium]|nr:SDR family oxidoreductase [Planctomycetaceae bacterium]